jgi:hypothetical protein
MRYNRPGSAWEGCGRSTATHVDEKIEQGSHRMIRETHHEEFTRLKRALQTFQSARLSRTYADLMTDPQYEKIGHFFFEKLYAPEDFSFRDTSIKRLHKLLRGKIYSGIISAVSKVIELHDLSDRLDDRMVEQMVANGIGEDMNMQQYQTLYRSLNNYEERLYQIGLGAEVTQIFYKLSKKWVVAVSLNTVRTAAHLIGMGKIIDFIYEGYEGFRAIKNIDYFIETVDSREHAWHEQLWSDTRPSIETLKKPAS